MFPFRFFIGVVANTLYILCLHTLGGSILVKYSMSVLREARAVPNFFILLTIVVKFILATFVGLLVLLEIFSQQFLFVVHERFCTDQEHDHIFGFPESQLFFEFSIVALIYLEDNTF